MSLATTLSEAEFSVRHPHAALIAVDGAQAGGGSAVFHTHAGNPRPASDSTPRATRPLRLPVAPPLEETHDGEAGPLTDGPALGGRTDPRIHFLVKSARNPFAHMITVGRSGNNDIVIDESTVSKCHAHFIRFGERWFLHDQGSTNGTFVGAARMTAKGAPVEDGAHVAFGPNNVLRFHTPSGLHRALLAWSGSLASSSR